MNALLFTFALISQNNPSAGSYDETAVKSMKEDIAYFDDMIRKVNASFHKDVLTYHRASVDQYLQFMFNESVTAANFLERGINYEMKQFDDAVARLDAIKAGQLAEEEMVKFHNNAGFAQLSADYRLERIRSLVSQLKELQTVTQNFCSEDYLKFPKAYFDPKPHFAELENISINHNPKSLRDELLVCMDPADHGVFGALNKYSNPIGMATNWTLSELEEATGLDLEAMKIITDPERIVGSTADVLMRYAKDRLGDTWHVMTSVMQGNLVGALDAINLREVSLAWDLIAESEIVAVPFELLPNGWTDWAKDQLMEEPYPNAVCPNDDSIGKVPTLYINGVGNTEPDAKGAAQSVADRLDLRLAKSLADVEQNPDDKNGQLFLIYNDSQGDDAWWKLARDRFFPFTYTTMAFGGKAISGSQKRLTWYLYHCSEKPINLICHSQGCLQSVNSILVAQSLKRGAKLRKNLAFIMTGSPVNEGEIGRGTSKILTDLRDPGDGISKWVGLKIADNFRTTPDHQTDHAFRNFYLHRIQKRMLWPPTVEAALKKQSNMSQKAKNDAEYGIYQTAYFMTKVACFSPAVASFVASTVTSAICLPLSIADAWKQYSEFQKLEHRVAAATEAIKAQMPTQEEASKQVDDICHSAHENYAQSWKELETAAVIADDFLKSREAESNKISDRRLAILDQLVSYYDKQMIALKVIEDRATRFNTEILPQRQKDWDARASVLTHDLRMAYYAKKEAAQAGVQLLSKLEADFEYEKNLRDAQSLLAFKSTIEIGIFKNSIHPPLEVLVHSIQKAEGEVK